MLGVTEVARMSLGKHILSRGQFLPVRKGAGRKRPVNKAAFSPLQEGLILSPLFLGALLPEAGLLRSNR